MANFQVYPTNLANPGRIGTIRMTLNIIFVLIIITHARGFESIKIFGGEGDLAAPYLSPHLIHQLQSLTGRDRIPQKLHGP